jgi:predicted Zn-dependent peptidase
LTQTIHTHTFANGLVLLAEPMEWLESAAFALLVPAGCSHDPAKSLGLGSLTCEMVQRGCGDRDSRQFVTELELLGADTSASVSTSHTHFGGAMPAESLRDTLTIYADVVRRPRLPADQFEDAQLVCLQEIRALEDDLPQQVFQELRLRSYGDPLGRAPQGTYEAVERIRRKDVQRYLGRLYQPQGAILSVAGRLDWPQLREHVERLFADWPARAGGELAEVPGDRRPRHLPHDSAQTHIGVTYPSVPYAHADYFQARAAVGVLSDGMSSRLFTEVRENRGLCYAVYAACHSLRDRGCVLCYAGTTTDRAQETLDVLLAELVRLGQGILPDELDRLKAKLKSGLIMQQESSLARSSSLAADWYHLGRPQTLDELGAIVDGLNCDRINRYLADSPPRDFTIVTLGAKPLETSCGVS